MVVSLKPGFLLVFACKGREVAFYRHQHLEKNYVSYTSFLYISFFITLPHLYFLSRYIESSVVSVAGCSCLIPKDAVAKGVVAHCSCEIIF